MHLLLKQTKRGYKHDLTIEYHNQVCTKNVKYRSVEHATP